MTAPLLEIRSLSKSFGGVEALQEVDLVVHPGEVVALVGDNAAGKSTLARVIAGILQPDAGQLLIDGSPVVIPNAQAAFALRIASVFQANALPENLDVVSGVFLGQERTTGGLLDEAGMEAEARRHLGRLGSRIPDLHVPLRTLSAGQRQSVAIARTLVTEPRLVVLDEPTSSLSVAQTAEVLGHIEDLRELGLGVILISHNLADVRAVADRIEVLRHGRNNGSFGPESSVDDVIAAITGARRAQ
ncbi:sugar ABC transporter ATP-binding protein [Arachnia propionica]|uniref:Sugar ABC transporter ATP-binding protein n=1 Tax=Arachnia propionica TaxID=1750 RepID=A0A3P1T4V2_9ACTN|nr:ATP-binding cassette domain-containing protein [Arachnia propionica]MDO5084337.1 ATP-binding cassette domain-containing protein [Arachnia propionica]RRD04205.1 sugar ABC transporter ATP-binding protein [Arachnia propionica]